MVRIKTEINTYIFVISHVHIRYCPSEHEMQMQFAWKFGKHTIAALDRGKPISMSFAERQKVTTVLHGKDLQCLIKLVFIVEIFIGKGQDTFGSGVDTLN